MGHTAGQGRGGEGGRGGQTVDLNPIIEIMRLKVSVPIPRPEVGPNSPSSLECGLCRVTQ